MSWHPIRRHRGHVTARECRAHHAATHRTWPTVDPDPYPPVRLELLPAPADFDSVGAGSTQPRLRLTIGDWSAA